MLIFKISAGVAVCFLILAVLNLKSQDLVNLIFAGHK
ncbi:MAG: hypothetical protein JWQ54_3608 [Mucilaginibacter sp.]|nr:hypothetical protein [Mucilaginibacter sp.]